MFSLALASMLSHLRLRLEGFFFPQVRQVVNFEFPTFMSDYIHRTGRVGRVGSEGTGIVHNYISRGYEVDLVWKIEVNSSFQLPIENRMESLRKQS